MTPPKTPGPTVATTASAVFPNTRGTFTSVAFNWRYSIHPVDGGPIFFDPQETCDRWLIHKGGDETRIIQSAQLIALLNEALTKSKFGVRALNLQTKQLLTFIPAN